MKPPDRPPHLTTCHLNIKVVRTQSFQYFQLSEGGLAILKGGLTPNNFIFFSTSYSTIINVFLSWPNCIGTLFYWRGVSLLEGGFATLWFFNFFLDIRYITDSFWQRPISFGISVFRSIQYGPSHCFKHSQSPEPSLWKPDPTPKKSFPNLT